MFRSVLLISIFCSACAYSYAGQDGKNREEEKIRQDVKVVEVKKNETTDTSKKPPVGLSKSSPQSPCGIEKFSIHFYEQGSRVEKVIDCKARRVVETKKEGFENALFEDAKAANIPAKTWYFFVDPHGNGLTELTNEHLIPLSREFEIEFFGRHEKRNLLIYTFLDKIQ